MAAFIGSRSKVAKFAGSIPDWNRYLARNTLYAEWFKQTSTGSETY
jgi:hypothetical protein